MYEKNGCRQNHRLCRSDSDNSAVSFALWSRMNGTDSEDFSESRGGGPCNAGGCDGFRMNGTYR